MISRFDYERFVIIYFSQQLLNKVMKFPRHHSIVRINYNIQKNCQWHTTFHLLELHIIVNVNLHAFNEDHHFTPYNKLLHFFFWMMHKNDVEWCYPGYECIIIVVRRNRITIIQCQTKSLKLLISTPYSSYLLLHIKIHFLLLSKRIRLTIK